MQLQKAVKPRSADIERCILETAENKPNALEQLYGLVSSAVYAYALTVTKNTFDAMDVMQECIVKVYESAGNYRSRGKPMAWILTIAKNLCYSKFRLQAHTCEMTDEQLEKQFADNEKMSVEDRLVVAKCLEMLSAQERTVVVLHAMSGLRHTDIAKLLQLPLSTVLSKYNRAIKKLKNILSEENL